MKLGTRILLLIGAFILSLPFSCETRKTSSPPDASIIEKILAENNKTIKLNKFPKSLRDKFQKAGIEEEVWGCPVDLNDDGTSEWFVVGPGGSGGTMYMIYHENKSKWEEISSSNMFGKLDQIGPSKTQGFYDIFTSSKRYKYKHIWNGSKYQELEDEDFSKKRVAKEKRDDLIDMPWALIKIINGSFANDYIVSQDITIRNDSDFDVKDVTIKYDYLSESGTLLKSHIYTLYIILKKGETREFNNLKVGLRHEQAVKCRSRIIKVEII
jgi:hypothetical protein